MYENVNLYYLRDIVYVLEILCSGEDKSWKIYYFSSTKQQRRVQKHTGIYSNGAIATLTAGVEQ